MDADEKRKQLDRVTAKIIGAAQRVSSALGIGFLEKVYENALAIELRKGGVLVKQQPLLKVFYEGEIVGEYAADLIVENEVVVELKAVRALDKVHQAQCMNYLRATKLTVCLLLNFGTSRLQVKRIVNGF